MILLKLDPDTFVIAVFNCPAIECAKELCTELEPGTVVDIVRLHRFVKGNSPVELPRAESTADLQITVSR